MAEGIEQLEKQLLLQHREYRSKANEYDVKSEQHEKLQQVRASPTTNRKLAVQCMCACVLLESNRSRGTCTTCDCHANAANRFGT